MESFGTYLKGHREKKGIRLEEIASITKIHLHNLELLEASRWDELPPEPFLRGFITAYAKYVGLETKEILSRFYETATKEEQSPVPPPLSETATRETTRYAVTHWATPKRIAAGFAAVFVLGIFVFLVRLGKESTYAAKTESGVSTTEPRGVAVAPDSATLMSPKDPERNTQALENAVAIQSPAVPAPTPSVKAPHEITLSVKERSWMKIVSDDKPPVEGFAEPGTTTTYDAQSKIKLVLGNSAGATVMYNGKPVEGNKFSGTIRSYRFPTNARFPQDVPKKPKEETPAAAPAEGTPATASP